MKKGTMCVCEVRLEEGEEGGFGTDRLLLLLLLLLVLLLLLLLLVLLLAMADLVATQRTGNLGLGPELS